MVAGDGTASGFISHWDYVAEKGLMNRNTAHSLKAAVSRILSVEGGDLDSLDIRSLQVDNLLDRFENLAKRDYTPESLSTYRSRFKRAHALYLSYLSDPRNYKPQGRERTANADRAKSKPSGKPTRQSVELPIAPGEMPRSLLNGLVRYPFPIREGVMAELLLPADLRPEEAKRLIAFLQSVSIEPVRMLPAHPDTPLPET